MSGIINNRNDIYQYTGGQENKTLLFVWDQVLLLKLVEYES
jgi:hypothetical protein